MNIKSFARVKLRCLKVCEFNPMEKIHFRENWLIFLGISGEAELMLRIWGAKENTFSELRNFLSGICGDQCIILRDKGSTCCWETDLNKSSRPLKIISESQFINSIID